MASNEQKTTDDPPVNLVEDTDGYINILIGSALALRMRDDYLVLLYISKDQIARRLTKCEAAPILSRFISRHNELLDCMTKVESVLSGK